MLKPNLNEEAVSESTLPADRIDVWIVPLDVDAAQRRAALGIRCPPTNGPGPRFAFERDRRRFVVGRGALRNILASYVGGQTGEIRFAYGEHGKPMLAESTPPDAHSNSMPPARKSWPSARSRLGRDGGRRHRAVPSDRGRAPSSSNASRPPSVRLTRRCRRRKNPRPFTGCGPSRKPI